VSDFYLYILFGCFLMSLCGALSWIDIRSFRLPNALTFTLMGTGLLQAYLLPYPDLKSALLGLVIGYLGFVLIEILFRRFSGKDGLGRGDAKLLAAGGAWVGWFGLPYIILLASLCGLVFSQLPSQKKKLENGQSQIPFGPFLCLGIIVVWASQLYFTL
jgi:prepilin signal peptidase PulO-like enzyme (type II secretory pathway)